MHIREHGDSILVCSHTQTGIWSVPKAGGPLSLAFDTGPHVPRWLDSNGVDLYWMAWSGTCVAGRSPLDGGPYEIVGTGFCMYGASCDSLYGTEVDDAETALYSLPTTGGVSEKVAEFGYRVVMGDTHVYLSDTVDIRRVPLAGGPEEKLATGAGWPFLLAVDETHVFWTDGSTPALMAAPR